MEHLVSRHVIVATGGGCKVICLCENTRNKKSQKRFSWRGDVVNETKAYTREMERVSRSALTPTLLIWVMMTRWGRGTSVEAEWESWVREKWLQGAECGRFGGGWFIHGAARSFCIRAAALCVAGREMRDSCAWLHNIFFKEITFQHRWRGWALRKLDLPLPDVSIFLRHRHRNNNNNVKTHFSFSLVCHSSDPTASATVFLYFLRLFLPFPYFQTRAWPSYVLNQNPHVEYGWEKLIDKPLLLGTACWKLSCAARESAVHSGDG